MHSLAHQFNVLLCWALCRVGRGHVRYSRFMVAVIVVRLGSIAATSVGPRRLGGTRVQVPIRDVLITTAAIPWDGTGIRRLMVRMGRPHPNPNPIMLCQRFACPYQATSVRWSSSDHWHLACGWRGRCCSGQRRMGHRDTIGVDRTGRKVSRLCRWTPRTGARTVVRAGANSGTATTEWTVPSSHTRRDDSCCLGIGVLHTFKWKYQLVLVGTSVEWISYCTCKNKP